MNDIKKIKLEQRSGRKLSPREIIEQLRLAQYELYSYEDFLAILRRRLFRWTGKTQMFFYTESMIVERLIREGIIEEDGTFRGR